jgi:hypothetical protein
MAYERQKVIGDWVEQRLIKREGKKGAAGWAPDIVKEWADFLLQATSKGLNLADVPAGPGAVEYLSASIEDPGWPSASSP